ncbi:Alkaline phosphatase D [Halioglobus japonicus]|nr:Alkaline phosphatase D [Halioglobus japonicus]
MPITRRKLLGLMSSSTFFLSISPGATLAAELPAGAVPLNFPQGVASADPQPDGIMLWTRAVPRTGDGAPVNLLVQLSKDADFSTVLLQAQLGTNEKSDYTVRSYIDGLTPDTQYYYRFLGGNTSEAASVSRIGRTRTAPPPDHTGKVNLAFASCQSYEQAYYGSWARMLEDDRAAAEEDRIHFVLHLGDFIYERCWKERPDGGPNSRTVPPFPNGVDTPENRYAVSLADYRHLYKTYLGDPHLQEARANWPFICTWDDHEFANDNYQSYVTYDGPGVLDAQRKTDANQAWFEYIPAVLDELRAQPAHDFQPQPPGGDEATRNQRAMDSLRIYRKLSWGKTLDIVLTDNRSYRSGPCLPAGFAESLGMPMNSVELVAIADAGRAYANGQPPATLPYGDGTVANPAKDRAPGSLLGTEQREWFLETVKNSAAPWKIWANALPLMPMRLDLSSLPMTGYEDSIFSIDSWSGYPYELGLLMQAFEHDKVTGVVSLSGDHHMHGAGSVAYSTTDANARPVTVDFAVAGISSSPIFEDLLAVAKNDHPDFGPVVYRETDQGVEPVWNISMTAGVLAAYTYAETGISALTDWLGPNTANPGLRYVDTTVNGYGLATIEADKVGVQLVSLQDCRQDFVKPPAIRHIARFSVPYWQAGEAPELEGPEFEGGAPFPFEQETV